MSNFFYSNILSIPSIAWVLAIVFKGVISWIMFGKFDMRRALSSGGMPSVHAALVTSITTAFAIKYGVYSDIFTVSLVFTVVILYDAINVRYESGLHATAINKLMGEQFNESLGHLPSEVLTGSMLGIITSIVLFYL